MLWHAFVSQYSYIVRIIHQNLKILKWRLSICTFINPFTAKDEISRPKLFKVAYVVAVSYTHLTLPTILLV